MKNFITTLLLLGVASGLWAQEQAAALTQADLDKRIAYMIGADIPKRTYINLAYVTQSLKFDAYGDNAAQELKSNQGFALEWGKTFFFNAKRPVAKMIRFGLDWSWMDVQYASFKIKGVDEDDRPLEFDSHFINFGMQIGPSVTVTPMKWLNIKAYVHYAPSSVGFSPSDFSNIKFGYAGYVTGGLQASFKCVTLGIEMRSATAKFSTINMDALNNIEIDEDSEEMPNTDDILDDIMGPKVTTKLPGVRFTVGFRF